MNSLKKVGCALIGAFSIYKLTERGMKMFMLTKDNVIVAYWVTYVLSGYPIEQVPTRWNLQKLVREVIEEQQNGEA